MRIYIIHPAKHDIEKIKLAEETLLNEGHYVVNPIPEEIVDYKEVDLFNKYANKINNCDAVFAMNKWEDSYIALIEMITAAKLAKTITFEQVAL